MTISVLITTYKRANLLSKAIESVLKQNFKDFEIIIVNDDPFGQDLSYEDPRIVCIKNKKNLGGAKSLNIGLKVAKGEYIAILDDDDTWISEDKLEKQVEFLEENPEHIIVGTSSIEIDKDNGKEVSRHIDDIELSLLRVPFAHSSILCRRNIMIEVEGYDEDLPRAKDINLYLKIAKLGKFGFLPGCFISHSEIFWKDENAKEFIKKRHRDLFFHRKVIWRHRKGFPHFWQSYLEVSLRYWIFKVQHFFYAKK